MKRSLRNRNCSQAVHKFSEKHIDYGMEHVVYLMVKKGNRGNREPVTVERLQLEQVILSRVILLEAYLEAWQELSHVCGVIRDKIQERCMEERSRESVKADPLSDANGEHIRPKTAEAAGLREIHRCFPDYQAWDRSFQRYLQSHSLTQEWLRVWRIPVYSGSGVSEQLQLLTKWVEGWQKLSQILVLGYDPGMLVWLPQLARRARGIHFYLGYKPRGMEEIQDWIYEEYGLVIKWQVLESRDGTEMETAEHRIEPEPDAVGQEAEISQELSGQPAEKTAEARGQQAKAMPGRRAQSYPGLSQYLRSYRNPCLVIDLTGLADISVTGLKPGSMWWDLGAMEEKRHLLEDRPLGIHYFSQQTLWRDMPS